MSNEEHPIAKFVRLQNGDDVISEVIETEDENGVTYTLFHPLKVVYVPDESSGYLTIAFMPWVFPRICEEQEFTIHTEDILFINDVSAKMNNYYWENLEQFTKKIEDYSTKQKSNQEELHTRIREALEEAGIEKKKVYH